MKIILNRQKKTTDGIIGQLTIDTSAFTCFTIENLALAIPAGEYDVTFDYSPRFNRIMPHVWVPSRDAAAKARGESDAGIRIHWGNFPSNYEGCIGVGDGEEADSIDNTVVTFNQLYKIIDGIQGLKIQINDIQAA